MKNNPYKRYSIDEIKSHPWIWKLFKSEGVNHHFYEEIESDEWDYYDDSNPENKFNNSKKLFKDQIFLTKITTSTMVPSLNPTANRKISLKGHLQAANLASLLGVTKNFNGNE